MNLSARPATSVQPPSLPHAECNASRPWWKCPPLTRHEVGILFLAYVALTAIYSLVGLAVTRWWEGSAAGEADADVIRWFESNRTSSRTDLAEFGSALSDTETKIALALALLPLTLWLYRRWRDWAFLVVALLFEVSVFATTSTIVGRARPPVEQLDGAPTNSWPSGHIAAAFVFYVGLAILILTHNRSRRSRFVALSIAIVAPLAVTVSRLYLGMHYVTDAIGGAVLAAITLWLVNRLLDRAATRRHQSDPQTARIPLRA